MSKPNREYIAMCILTTASYDQAAKKSGVSKTTLYRLRQEPEFQELIVKIKNDMFQDTLKKAQVYSMESLEVLKEIMHDTSATDSSRVAAARTILELGLNSAEQELILNKIEALERVIAENA